MRFMKDNNINRRPSTMNPGPGVSPCDTVSITTEEYEQLLRDSAELSRLRAALQPGERETQSPLCLDSSHAAQPDGQITAEHTETPQSDFGIDSNSDGGVRLDMASLASALEESLEESVTEETLKSEKYFVPQQNLNQSVILLPPVPVTHAQVAAAVRGGALLQIYLQRFRNQVNVTFARSEDAAAFFEYTQSGPFYVAGRLTTVQWAPRAYIAPDYVIQQVIDGGVSRNLVIEKVKPKVTEAMIRRDLNHIHNMAVISVHFEKDNAYISTTSVAGALYARTCMKSRALYKDMWISFYEDECAKPLRRARHRHSAAVATASIPEKDRGLFYNPFDLLSQDEFEFDEDEIEEH